MNGYGNETIFLNLLDIKSAHQLRMKSNMPKKLGEMFIRALTKSVLQIIYEFISVIIKHTRDPDFFLEKTNNPYAAGG